MDMELQGKVVFITGGSKGLGLACARAFAKEGARVAIGARSAGPLEAAVRTLAAEGLTVHAFGIDLDDAGAFKTVVTRIEDTLGPIDVLVNSAGSAKQSPHDSTETSRWADGMRNKYLPTVHALDEIVPRMAKRGGGAVVNIAGTGGKAPTPTHMPGGAANAAILLVTAAFAKAWGPKGVRVNAINPGATETERLVDAIRVQAKAAGQSEAEYRAQAQSRIPLRRYGKPDDTASMAVFLASARASYVNGAIVAVDGGTSAAP